MPDKLKPKALVGKYKLEEKLWEGTFAETWKASHNREVFAVQAFHEENFLEQLPKILAEINFVEYEDTAKFVTRDKTTNAFVWEYIKGRKLHTFIRELKKIKVNIAVYIARKALEVLAYTASQGLVHGGLRPTRIIITPEKKVKITNFGVGQIEQRVLCDIINENKDVPATKEILHYFPSEVIEDKLFDDPKSDVYAMGIILAEMLVGEKATEKEIPRLLYEKNVQRRLVTIITKAIDSFENRYNHPNEMHYDLTCLLQASANVAKIYVPPPKAGLKNISLEAVPADSEEYRIYQADQISAKQTIDADVVVAEPAYISEDELQEDVDDKTPSSIMRKTTRLDKDSLLLISTFSNKILDPLNKEPLWPKVILRYGIATIIISFLILFGAFSLTPGTNSTIWLMEPFNTMEQWPSVVQKVIYAILSFISLSVIFIPFWDKDGQFVLNSFFIPFLTTLLAGSMGLGLWRQVDAAGGWFGLSGGMVCAICIILGITLGIFIPNAANFLRKQMGDLRR